MRTKLGILLLAVAATAVVGLTTSSESKAFYGYRQYYSSWSYRPSYNYYYTRYYYKPTPTYSTYSYHYCVYRPSQPRYVYYYNPHSRHYWGRFDCEGTPGAQYSLLKPEDRKEKLEEIPESSFPKPGPMPAVPDAADGTKSDGQTITPITNLPTEDATPDDLPAAPTP
ncbi:MAG: hypothetical protein KDA89_24120 [Planctomycetaceae bacterium]|nr:hypothetical protein [Planctomycetaceae bacterium]